MIYFIQRGDDGPIKIGRTKNVKSRLTALQSANSYKLTVLMVVDEQPGLEVALHRRFQDLRIRGEWFHPGAALLAWIAEYEQIHPLPGAGGVPAHVVRPKTKKERRQSAVWQQFARELILRIQCRKRGVEKQIESKASITKRSDLLD